jgi:hypothetical protein
MVSRYENFKLWYAKLRGDGWNMWNSFWWAFDNSKTHNLDGSYWKKDNE